MSRIIRIRCVCGAGGVAPVSANSKAVKLSLMEGLYVTAFGTVKAGSVTGSSYVITDGSDDAGIRIITPGALGVNQGDFVVVSGAAGFDGARVIYKK